MALDNRSPAPGLVHHSDRGVQYASNDYTGLLKDRQITISMSRKGNPYDNAFCESFMKTLKYDEAAPPEYRDLAEEASIEHFLERVYNQKRLGVYSATPRRRTSKTASGGQQERGYESDRAFFQAWRNLSLRWVFTSCRPGPKRRISTGPAPAKRTRRKFPRPTHRRDEFRPALFLNGLLASIARLRFSPARPSRIRSGRAHIGFTANWSTVP